MKQIILKCCLIFSLLLIQNVGAEEYVVGQKNKEFTMDGLTIKVGDSVSFLNEDSFHHNIFSLSDSIIFDLGSYKQGEAKSVTFDQPGVVDIECAIHPNMQLTITVE